jgi:hypothetical protein
MEGCSHAMRLDKSLPLLDLQVGTKVAQRVRGMRVPLRGHETLAEVLFIAGVGVVLEMEALEVGGAPFEEDELNDEANTMIQQADELAGMLQALANAWTSRDAENLLFCEVDARVQQTEQLTVGLQAVERIRTSNDIEEEEKQEAGDTREKTTKQEARNGGGQRGRSISRAGIMRIAHELGQLASQSSEAWRNRTRNGSRITSHDLRSVFMNLVQPDSKTNKEEVFPGAAPFHPSEKYPEVYLEEDPDAIITYTWNLCIITELPRFLQPIEEELEEVLGREPR